MDSYVTQLSTIDSENAAVNSFTRTGGLNFARGIGALSVKIRLVGRVAVETSHALPGEALLTARQVRLVFALLVIERRRPVGREELAEALWPRGVPRTWYPALRGVVSKVRGFLAATGLPENVAPFGGLGTYQLQLPRDVVVDVEAAHAALETAERLLCCNDVDRSVEFADYARSIAERPFLADVEGDWVGRVRDRLGTVRIGALCVLAESYSQQGRYRLAVQTAQDALALEPFSERTHQLLMRVHTAAGDSAEALRVYERCRRLLAAELGIDPTAGTVALYHALLRDA